MRTIVIGDLHGDWQGLIRILDATGAIDADARRVPGTKVIQLGDFIHGGVSRSVPRPGVDDERCAVEVFARCDVALIGNHELPHLYPDADFPTFGGQRPISRLLRDFLDSAARAGRLVPALANDGWLLTHAGLHQQYTHYLATSVRDAEVVAAQLGTLFAQRVAGMLGAHPVIDGVGQLRGGRHLWGGIFWADWRELTALGMPAPVPQVVGHTPQGDAPRRSGDLWGCDVGAALSGRVCALVQDGSGEDWSPVVVESATGRVLIGGEQE